MPKRRKKIIEGVKAIDLGDKGQTIGKTPEGEVVIINGGCVPGDVIDYVALRKKKGLKFGITKQVVEFSQDRVEPVCQHFGTCGGCKWQNLSYEAQLKYKHQYVSQAIKRLAKDDEAKVSAIVGCDQLYEYRNKLEYSFSTKRWLTIEEIESGEDYGNEQGLGFHVAGAFDKVLNIEKCHLQDDYTNKIRNTIRTLAKEHDWSYYDIRNHHGLLRNVMIRNTSTGSWMFTMIFGEDDKETINTFFQVMMPCFPEINAWHYIINTKANSSTADLQSVHVAGDENIIEHIGELKFYISPKSFFQTNSFQTQKLYDIAKNLAGLKPTDIVYDLYTGTGSIALYLAFDCSRVVGIEQIPEAIADAHQNAALNNITNADFLVGDVKDVLDISFRDKYGTPDVIVTDPPRAGMHSDVVETLLMLCPPKIVYISCNPSTQARDISLLKEKYELVEVVPVDMFPHTSHIESVALLQLPS